MSANFYVVYFTLCDIDREREFNLFEDVLNYIEKIDSKTASDNIEFIGHSTLAEKIAHHGDLFIEGSSDVVFEIVYITRH